MYDDHKLTRSKDYFIVSQILRIFEDWINDSKTNLEQLRKLQMDWKSYDLLPLEAQSIIDSNWDILLLHATASCENIKNLIQRKRNEIQSLRDGVCTMNFPQALIRDSKV